LDVRRRYRRTVIGPFWTTLSLGVFIFALGVVWTQLWKQEIRNYLPFLSSGMIVWVFFSAMISEGCGVYTAAQGLITQFRFPYSLLTLSLIWRNVITLAHNLVIFVVIALFLGVPVTPATFLAIPGLALICLNAFWICTVLGILCTRFRDIQQVVTSILQISMFVTPIFWAPEQITGRAAILVDWNILYHYIDLVRSPLLGRAPPLWSWFMVISATLCGWGLMIVLFARFRSRIPYWI
jgi:ABC-type polysaccharide/polyol phosphate export permease